jgi:hypothetical protein
MLLIFFSCGIKIKNFDDDESNLHIKVQRYDRIESRYLTTGDFSALQQLSTGYPTETRTLIEDVLQLGEVDEPNINNSFLNFYQDTLLQTIISDVEAQYANMDDINKELTKAFQRLQKYVPGIHIPMVYAQIGALDQSIVVGNQTIGICLDKYLGKDYPLYKKYYNSGQIESMTRSYIVPDCISFYLLSVYSSKNSDKMTQLQRDLHVGKMTWVVNKLLDKDVFTSKYTVAVGNFMHHNPNVTIRQLLEDNDYSVISQYVDA